jgi:hypothetical protein
MFGWIPFVLWLFTRYEPRRAVITAFLAAWLFLPIYSYPLPGLPDYTKISATCWGVLIAAAIFDSESLKSAKITAVDIPMIIFCMSPLFSSLSNGLGLYDGVASLLTQTVEWGFPYFIGRVYFSSLKGIRELAIGYLVGGLIYVPLVLLETRLSPQLHRWVYGWHQHDFSQTFRWGGWRPMVFMEHGLMVGMWMASSTLIGVWLWKTKVIEKLGKYKMKWLVYALLFAFINARSTGAIALFMVGVAVLFLTVRMKNAVLVLLLASLPFLYIYTRSTGYWSGENLVNFISKNLSEDRAASLKFRFDNENILAKKAMQRPVFGWGGWGRARVYNRRGEDISVTDGLWIIIFGNNGMVGIFSLTFAVLMPVFVVLRHYPAKYWGHPAVAPAAVLSILLCLYMIDNCLNAMVNPTFMLAGGALAGLTQESLETVEEPEEGLVVVEEEPVPVTRFL